ALPIFKIKFSFILVHFNIILYHCTFRVMIFERSMILCLVVYNFVLVERNLLLFVIPYIIIIYSLRKEVDIMNYISVKAASEKWCISERRIQKLCEYPLNNTKSKLQRDFLVVMRYNRCKETIRTSPKPCTWRCAMYRYSNGQISLSDFKQPVGMNLKENNRWVKKAQTIPWLEIEH